MSEKLDALDVGSLLAKNPKAAGVFKANRKKLTRVQTTGRRSRDPKQYNLGLPYERSLATSTKALAASPANRRGKPN